MIAVGWIFVIICTLRKCYGKCIVFSFFRQKKSEKNGRYSLCRITRFIIFCKNIALRRFQPARKRLFFLRGDRSTDFRFHACQICFATCSLLQFVILSAHGTVLL